MATVMESNHAALRVQPLERDRMSRAQAITDGEIVLAAVDVPVAPQRAFEALNSSEVETWWGAPGLYSMRGWRSDMRVGGRWSVDVCLPGGTIHPAGGEYLIVDAPRRVTLSRQYHWDHPTLGRQVTRVTYRFEPIEGCTRVTVRQDEFGSLDAAREHATGWARTLDLLHTHLTEAAGVSAGRTTT